MKAGGNMKGYKTTTTTTTQPDLADSTSLALSAVFFVHHG
jgi:hypothetical protein